MRKETRLTVNVVLPWRGSKIVRIFLGPSREYEILEMNLLVGAWSVVGFYSALPLRYRSLDVIYSGLYS